MNHGVRFEIDQTPWHLDSQLLARDRVVVVFNRSIQIPSPVVEFNQLGIQQQIPRTKGPNSFHLNVTLLGVKRILFSDRDVSQGVPVKLQPFFSDCDPVNYVPQLAVRHWDVEYCLDILVGLNWRVNLDFILFVPTCRMELPPVEI